VTVAFGVPYKFALTFLMLLVLSLVKISCICFLADINECSGANNCSVNSTCTNTNGSYTCECHAGFTLLADQRTCQGTLFNIVAHSFYCLITN